MSIESTQNNAQGGTQSNAQENTHNNTQNSEQNNNAQNSKYIEVPARRDSTGGRFERFVEVIAALRSKNGCPWDLEQTHSSISRNMIEEAYEALDAIERGDTDDMAEELGDVLLEVVLQAQIASDESEFTIDDVIEGITSKIIRRHPHVFGETVALAAAGLSAEEMAEVNSARSPGDVEYLWNFVKKREKQLKQEEREQKAIERGETLPPKSILDDVSRFQPALMQAQDISEKAVSHGFEWEAVDDIWLKFSEETQEYRRAVETYKEARLQDDPDKTHKAKHAAELEFGDMLFTLVNVARKDGLDAETTLRKTCNKFRKRWALMESYAAEEDKTIDNYDIDELDALWERAKKDLCKAQDV